MSINIVAIKKLRTLSGLGVLECKQALIKNNGDIKSSLEYLRNIGNVKVEQKLINLTSKGSVFLSTKKKVGVILKLNCESDFVAKNVIFKNFGNKVLNFMILNRIGNLAVIKNIFNEEIRNLVLKFRENIIIKKTGILKTNNLLSSYVHGSKIAVLVSGKSNSRKLLKKISMHIAAIAPKYLIEKDIPKKILENEYKIQMKIALLQGKKLDISKKIVDGRMKKFINNNTLLGQEFIFINKITVGQFLKDNNIYIESFIRFSV